MPPSTALLLAATAAFLAVSASATLDLNATKAALGATLDLKVGDHDVVDAAAARFAGQITCYDDPATGDVVGLRLGAAEAPLCSSAGTPRSFDIAADEYVAAFTVSVDKATGLVGSLTFVIKSDASKLAARIVSCGTQGVGLGADIMPPLSALSAVSATCKPIASGRRRLQQAPGLAIDPASLSVTVTTLTALAGSTPPSPPGPPVPTPTPHVPVVRTLYITNGDNSVSICKTADGPVTTCTRFTDPSFSSPSGVSLSGGYAYITNGASNTISICTIGAGGALTSPCAQATDAQNFVQLVGITLAGGKAYLASTTGSVVACNSVTSTQVAGCTPFTDQGNFYSQSGVAFAGSTMFTSDNQLGVIYSCPTPLTTCSQFNTGVPAPAGMTTNAAGTLLYAADNGSPPAVDICTVTAGAVTACSPATDPSFNGPFGVALGDGVVYVTNVGTNTVSTCPLNGAGTAFAGACTSSPGSGTLNNPSGIAIAP